MASMQLNDYLEQPSVDRTVFAERLGVHPDTLYKWQRGDRVPRREMMQKITELTNGVVTANDFFKVREATG